MRKAFDIAIILAFTAVIAGPMDLLAFEKTNVQLPSWLTSEDSQYLAGNLAKANLEESLNMES